MGHARTDTIALAFPIAAALSLHWLTPSRPFAHLDEPAWWGAFGILATVAAVVALRLAGDRMARLERVLLAVFLAGMPVIYLGDALRHGARQPWLALEVAGVPVFVGFAALGLWRSPWWLVAGIAGHGLLWDSWHHGTVGHVPHWYAASCLLVDLGFAVYAWARLPAWRTG